MDAKELLRYSRQYILPEVGESGQQKLKDAKVLVIGAGGLGSPVLLYLVASGVGTIGIADFDEVDVSNLQRQVLYGEEDIGNPKAEVAAAKLRAQNPWCSIQVFKEKVDHQNVLELVQQYDVIVDGSDNFATRYLVNDACILASKPLVFGSIYKFEGQVSVFNYQGSGSYRCLFPEVSDADELANCSVIGVIGVLPGMVGTFQANEVLKIILGIGEVLAGKLLVIDALTMQFNSYSYEKNEKNFDQDLLRKNIQEPRLNRLPNTSEITPEEFQQLISQQKDVQLLDVRDLKEYSKKNIGGIHIPLASLRKNHSMLKKDIPVIVYCQTGVRSKQAVRMLLEDLQFSEVRHLRGGLDAWYALHN